MIHTGGKSSREVLHCCCLSGTRIIRNCVYLLFVLIYKFFSLSCCVKIPVAGEQCAHVGKGLPRACDSGFLGACGLQGLHPGCIRGRAWADSPLSEKCWYCLSFHNAYFLLIGLLSLFHLSASLQNQLILKCQIQIGPGAQSCSFSTQVFY